MKTTAIFLLSTLAYTAAYICCPPKQWEGMFGENGGYVIDKTRQTGLFSMGALFHMDIGIKKVAVETFTSVKIVQDYEKKIQYMVVKGKCTKTKLQGTVEDSVCIPDNARYLNTLHYQVNDMITDNYVYEQTMQGVKAKILMNVERTMCIPFGFSGISNTKEASAIFSGGYFNTTSTIKDPSVFDVPSVCNNSSIPIEKPNDVTTSHFIEALISEFNLDSDWF